MLTFVKYVDPGSSLTKNVASQHSRSIVPTRLEATTTCATFSG